MILLKDKSNQHQHSISLTPSTNIAFEIKIAFSKIVYNFRNAGVKAAHVHHVRVIWVGDGEFIALHSTYDKLGVFLHLLAVFLQRFVWMDMPNPCIRICVHDENIDVQVLL